MKNPINYSQMLRVATELTQSSARCFGCKEPLEDCWCHDMNAIDAYLEASDPDWCMWQAAQGREPGYEQYDFPTDYTSVLATTYAWQRWAWIAMHVRVPVYLEVTESDPFSDC